MSKRYIDADALKEKKVYSAERHELVVPVAEIDWQPTADVAEVRRGEWIYHECVSSYDGCISGYACSLCNSFVDDECFEAEEFHKKFCGNCGAKMDGGREENEGYVDRVDR